MTLQWVKLCLVLACVAFAGRAKAAHVDLAGTSEANDKFGDEMAVGDFDCDGDDDLILSVRGEDSDRGAINVVYAGPAGLGTPGNKQLNALAFLYANGNEYFGSGLAAGDFDADGCDDIAIGTSGTDLGTAVGAGAVIVAYGDPEGIDPVNSELWHQDSGGVGDVAESGDGFGSTLAAADFDGDGFDDLVVGVPFEDVGGITSAGAVNVLYGSASGVTAAGDQFIHLNTTGVKGTADEYENFGWVFATGDFNGDEHADLAVGVFADGVDGIHNAGSVLVLPGSATGLNVDDDDLFTRESLGFVADFALFGYDVAAGDFDGDGKDDLAIGCPADDAGGAAHVLRGTTSGLSASGAQYWTQLTQGIPSDIADLENFGAKLAAGNFSGGPQDDLAIANYEETVSGFERAGAVTVLFGSSSGLSTQTAPAFIHQDQTSDEEVEEFDKYGLELESGDFDGNGFDELLVAVPLESLSGFSFVGAVHVYYGSTGSIRVDRTSQFLRQ
jgi:hypothetical protein